MFGKPHLLSLKDTFSVQGFFIMGNMYFSNTELLSALQIAQNILVLEES